MLTIDQIRTTLPRDSYTPSIDLQDAYWHFPIQEHFRAFLGFRLDRLSYRFRVMPCGLNLAPRVFTQLVKVIPKNLTLKGIQVMAYLDDWLVWADSMEECAKAMCMGIQTLQDCRFLINWVKSRLPPA